MFVYWLVEYSRSMKKLWIIAAILCTFTIRVEAQSTLGQRPQEAQFSTLETAWIERNWTAAYQISKEYLDNFPNSGHAVRVLFIHLYSGLKMGRDNQDRACQTFLANHPQRPEAVQLRLALADFYFNNGKYAEAVKQYNQLSYSKVSRKEKAEAEFKKGYSYYAMGRRAEALTQLRPVIEYPGEYRYKAAYYSGFILYQNKDYIEALTYLKIADEGTLADVSALIADAYYQLGQGAQLQRYVSERAPTAPRESKTVLYRLLGEVLFEEKNYVDASTAFEQALASSEGAVDAIVYYKNALSYDLVDAHEQAIDNYKISGLDKSEIGQLSAFRLGQLYLDEENYPFASQSFEQASGLSYNEEIKEQSTFLSGKLRLAARAYDEGINKLLEFRQQYPDSKWSSESAELVAQALLLTTNYDRAIQYVEGLTVQSSKTRATYQKVCFLKGEQLFSDGQFNEAIRYLDKSFVFTPDFDVFIEGKFLAAEAFNNLENIERAETLYNEVLAMSSPRRYPDFHALALYNLGYIAYNNREYPEAETLFSRFLNLGYDDVSVMTDARVRYGDCLYANKKYDAAKRQYEGLLATSMTEKDYVQYQMGLLYYQSDKYQLSAQAFDKVVNQYPESPYTDNARFQKAQMWFEQAKFEESLREYHQLIATEPTSGLLPFAIMRRGLAHMNLEQYDQAQKDFVATVRQYPTHKTANDAILALQDLQKRNIDVPGFADVLAYFREANPSNSSLESIDFEQIKTAYFRQDYARVNSLALEFEKQYPESNFQLDVQYYVADGYYQSEQWEESIREFNTLAERPSFGYYQRVLDKRGKAMLATGSYLAAINNYHLLQAASRNNKEQYLAREGLMYAYLEMNPDSAFFYGDLIRNASWKPLNAELKAQMVQLKVRRMQERLPEALDIARAIVGQAPNEIGAEANYYVATILRSQGEFQASNEACFDLLSNFASYSEWTDQAYLLLVANYLSLDEVLQAEATVNSILANAKDPAIIANAQQLKEDVDLRRESLLQSTETDSLSVPSNSTDSIR